MEKEKAADEEILRGSRFNENNGCIMPKVRALYLCAKGEKEIQKLISRRRCDCMEGLRRFWLSME